VKSVEYQVTWRWRDGTSVQFDVVSATTAERAIAKVRKLLGEEYALRKSDVVIIEVVRYNGRLG